VRGEGERGEGISVDGMSGFGKPLLNWRADVVRRRLAIDEGSTHALLDLYSFFLSGNESHDARNGKRFVLMFFKFDTAAIASMSSSSLTLENPRLGVLYGLTRGGWWSPVRQ
jgi:hypothetical protein